MPGIRKNPLMLILFVGFLLRLIAAMNAPVDLQAMSGGDTRWYLANGYAFWEGTRTGTALGFRYDLSVMPTAPLYLLFVGAWQHLLSLENAIIAIRIVQVLLATSMIYIGYDMGLRISNDRRVGIVSAALLAFSPTLIAEPKVILSESLYIFFIMLGIGAFLRAIDDENVSYWFVLVAVLALGLATLTRAVSLLYPLGLAGLLLIKYRKRGLQAALLLCFVYISLVGTWTTYNWIVYDRLVIGSNQFTPSLWRGAVEGDTSPETNDAMLGEQTYSEQATDVIRSDPKAFLQRRFIELAGAYLRPYGTAQLGSDSITGLFREWTQSGFAPSGLWHLLSAEGFWLKLLIYIWHYGGLLGGLLGMYLLKRRWLHTSVLIGFIVYTTLLHLVVLALPRYIFPIMSIYWIFLAVTFVTFWDMLQRRR